jgi:hypothetical protein
MTSVYGLVTEYDNGDSGGCDEYGFVNIPHVLFSGDLQVTSQWMNCQKHIACHTSV